MNPPRRLEADGWRRAVTVAGILALLVSAAVVDKAAGQEPGPKASSAGAAAPGISAGASAVPDGGDLSSSWYCWVGTQPTPTGPASATPAAAPRYGAGPGRAAGPPASLVLANTTGVVVRGRVATVGVDGDGRTVSVAVPAQGQLVVDESHLVKGPDVAATVSLDGGGVAVEQRLAGTRDMAASPCASSTAGHWYFASGSTAGGDSLLVSLYNPLLTTAIADVSFATGQGPARPDDDQGLVIAPHQQVVLDVGSHVQERSLVATSVRARLGQLVADEVQVGSDPSRAGLALVLGASAPATVWDFPAGLVAPGATESVDLYNPSPQVAQLEVDLSLSSGTAEPLRETVGPGAVVALVANAQPRIPVGRLFGTNISSLNGVPIVAERAVLDRSPRPIQGRADALGGQPAREWVLAAGAPNATTAESVVIENPGQVPATVGLTTLAAPGPIAVPGLAQLTLLPGRPVDLSLAGRLHRSQVPVVVTGDVPVVVERDLSPVSGPGLSATLGEPSR